MSQNNERAPTHIKQFIVALLNQGYAADLDFANALTASERNANGTCNFWCAKDHFAHRTYWHQDVIRKIREVEQNAKYTKPLADEDAINTQVWQENQLKPWAEIWIAYTDSNNKILELVESLSEATLTASGRYSWLPVWAPSYATFLGNCYEHDQEHLMQYWVDRGDFVRAQSIRENCDRRIILSDLPNWIKGWFKYNCACFYVANQYLDLAANALRLAIEFDSRCAERAKADPQLAAIRKMI